MNKELWDKAAKLAAKPYKIEVYHDEESDAEVAYLARIVEMSGCMAQGATIEEALSSLRDAAVDYIYFLLEDGLPVPPPISLAVQTGGIATTFTPEVKWQSTQKPETDFEAKLTAADELNDRDLLYSHQLTQ